MGLDEAEQGKDIRQGRTRSWNCGRPVSLAWALLYNSAFRQTKGTSFEPAQARSVLFETGEPVSRLEKLVNCA